MHTTRHEEYVVPKAFPHAYTLGKFVQSFWAQITESPLLCEERVLYH